MTPHLIRPLLFVVCAVAGYGVTASLTRPSQPVHLREANPAGSPPPAPAPASPDLPASSAATLREDWDAMRAEHGKDAADLPALYLAAKFDNSFRRRAFRSVIIAEWAAVDPRAGLAFLLEKDKWMAGQFAREWMRLDPDAAVSGLLAAGEKTRDTLRSLLGEIARLSPDRLVEVVNALPVAESRWDTTTQDAFGILAKKDLESARAAAQSVTGPLREQALSGIAMAWAEQDGKAALAWAQQLPAGETRDAVLRSALTGLAKTDPMAALDRINLVPPGGDEMSFASDIGARVLREAAKTDWDRTLQWIEAHPGVLGHQSYNGLVGALSQRLVADPEGMMRSLAQRQSTDLAMVLGNSLLNEGYAKADQIWKWLEGQPDSPFVRGAQSSLLNAMAWKEPARALEHLDAMAASGGDPQLIEQGVRSMLNGGSAMDQFEDFYGKASPKIRGLLVASAFAYGQESIGADAPKWIARLDEVPAEQRTQAMAGLAGGWAAADPQAALAWASAIPDPSERSRALDAATRSWIRDDMYSAAEWIDTLDKGATRDTAAQAMVNVAAQKEPETAWTWALTVESPEQRRNALMTAYGALHRKDPDLARDMVRSAGLPREEADALETHFRK